MRVFQYFRREGVITSASMVSEIILDAVGGVVPGDLEATSQGFVGHTLTGRSSFSLVLPEMPTNFFHHPLVLFIFSIYVKFILDVQ